MEIPIVNEKDELITYKKFDTEKQEEIYRVSALWITNSKGDILLAKRALTKSHSPGKWGPAVAGTVEKRETYESNILKEAGEELSIFNESFEESTKLRVKGEHNYFCQWYTIVLDWDLEQFKPRVGEVAEVKWWSRKELIDEVNTNPGKFVNGLLQSKELFLRE